VKYEYLINDLNSSLFLYDRKNNTIIKNFPKFKSTIKDMIQLKSGVIVLASNDNLINILDPYKNFQILKAFQASNKPINTPMRILILFLAQMMDLFHCGI